MIYIEKGKEPSSLIKYKKTCNACYDNYRDKNDVKQSLLREQGYLCAYCMQRIDIDRMKIEHWKPQVNLSRLEGLDYKNMLGVCRGHEDGTNGEDDICDAHKKDKPITVNPLDKDSIAKIKYRSATGEIFSDDEVINHDLNVTLNLNNSKHHLKENRKLALAAVQDFLYERKNKGEWSARMLQKVKKNYECIDSDGKKKEYAGIIIWYLNKKCQKYNN